MYTRQHCYHHTNFLWLKYPRRTPYKDERHLLYRVTAHVNFSLEKKQIIRYNVVLFINSRWIMSLEREYVSFEQPIQELEAQINELRHSNQVRN